MDSALQLVGLGKWYAGGTVALKDVNLTLEAGEALVILGPSGSGKSTFLRLIVGLDDPSEGDVLIDGQSVRGHAAHLRNVRYLAQRPVLYPGKTVRENLIFGLARPQTDLAEALAVKLGIGGLLGRRSSELSGGERQRVALGRVMLRPGGLLLLDEPLASLDGPLRIDVRGILHLLQRRERATMIYVTHDQDEAVTLADRLAVLEQGRLVQVGTVTALSRCPATTFVARHFGWPPMTFLRGSLVWRDSLLHLHADGKQRTAPPTWGPFGGRDVLVGIRPLTAHDAEAPELNRAYLFDSTSGLLLLSPDNGSDRV